jgi:hypothetical protein
MKIIRNMLKKCCTPTQTGKPGFSCASADTMVPGYRAMKSSTDGIVRRPCATATAEIKTTKPIGSNQRRLNHRFRPTRTRGGIPYDSGNHFVTSTASSPTMSCRRKLLPKFGRSSAAWPKRIRPGERPGSMENSRNWASPSPNEP